VPKKLSDEEVEAVLAHELSHIRSEDVRLMMIAMIFTNVVSIFNVDGFLSPKQRHEKQLFAETRTARLEASYSGNNSIGWNISSNADAKGVFELGVRLFPLLVVLCGGMLLSWLAYFSLSKKREYIADAEAVVLTKKPLALISALGKIEGNSYVRHLPQHLMAMAIDDGDAKYGFFFKSHPSIHERIEKIAEMSRAGAFHGRSML
jgi:heat shock protein HtpX